MSAIKFRPWRGARYAEGFLGRRVLILGESHYHDLGDRIDDNPDITRQVVELQFDGSGTTYSFFTHIAKTFVGPDLYLDAAAKAAFWNQVAFYNYVQQSVGVGARVRPTDALWASGEAPFFEVLDELKPEVIVALGYELWNNLPNTGRTGPQLADQVRPRTWIYPHAGGSSLAYGVIHPSSGGYSSTEWHPRIMEVLRLAAKAS